MEIIKGIVKKVKNDKKGIMLDNDKWYSNNFKSELNVNVGDEIEVEYKINGNFNNYESVKVLTKVEKTSKVSKDDFNPVTALTKFVADIKSKNPKLKILDITEDILLSYFRIKQVLASSDDFVIKYEKEITGILEQKPETPEKESQLIKPEEL